MHTRECELLHDLDYLYVVYHWRGVLLYFSAVSLFFFFKQKTAYEVRISDWSSDVCSSDLSFSGAASLSSRSRCSPGCRPFRSLSTRRRRSTAPAPRSEARRVGKECVGTCSSRW